MNGILLELSTIGSCAIGAVWGWLLSQRFSHTTVALSRELASAVSSAVLATQQLALAGAAGLLLFLGTALAAACMHFTWQSLLRRRIKT